MSKTKEALEMALEALESKYVTDSIPWRVERRDAIAAIREALAEQEHAAVGEAGKMPGTDGFTMACFHAKDVPVGTKLYTHPAPANQQASVPEDLIDRLVAVSSAIADQDDRAAQSILRDTLSMLAAAPEAPAPSEPKPAEFGKQPDLSTISAPQAPAWQELSDQDRQEVFESMPDMLEGFLKKWGWLHFAKGIEEKCRAKNGGGE